jgi:hypothetical protein
LGIIWKEERGEEDKADEEADDDLEDDGDDGEILDSPVSLT